MDGDSFEEKLEFGKAGEKVIIDWLCRSGYSVLPVEKASWGNGGPRIYQANSSLVAPDLLVLQFGWIEAKTKSAFTWHRISQSWQTGIDVYYYNQYIEAARKSCMPIYLFFLQLPGQAKDSPSGCPTGLYGGDLTYLQEHEHHRHSNWGKGGMVYWAESMLKKFADLEGLSL